MSAEPIGAELSTEDLLTITWSDGRTLAYPLDHLRAHCPCAHCAPTVPSGPRKVREDFPGIRLASLEEVGRYAFRVGFTDGHDLGLYTWSKLREIGFDPASLPPKPAAPAAFDV